MSPALRVRRSGTIYTADWGGGPRTCAIGPAGIGEKLREGDGVTPYGLWPLRRVFYRPDRLAPPRTTLPLAALAPDDGWCDAPADPQYNRLVKLPYGASAERLWRDDGLYDLLITIGFNDAPVRPGRGSAIFLHVAQADYSATQGCVALSREDLLDAVATLDAGAVIDIHP